MNQIDTSSIFAASDFKPHWREDLTDEQYHADKTAIGSTSLRKALYSPRAFYQDFFIPRPLKKERDVFRIGKIIHKAILEGSEFKKKYVVEPEFWGFTKEGVRTNSASCKEVKDKKAAWYADLPKDAIVVTEEEREMIVGQVEAIMDHEDGIPTLKNGIPERAGYYVDEKTGIRLKIKPDLHGLSNENGILKLVDLKTTQDASERKFGSSAYSYRYDFQLYMYAKGIEAITGKFPDVIVIIAIEKEPPFECGIYYIIPKDDLTQAAIDYRIALDNIAEAVKTGKWNQRQKRMQRLYCPTWFISESVERTS